MRSGSVSAAEQRAGGGADPRGRGGDQGLLQLTRSRPAKRAFDIALASLGLVAASPVMVAVWARMRLIDRDGPVLYGGRRVGAGGREFRMYKFRSMVTNADKIGGADTPDDDPRLTKTGRFLRKYKLDELPQLINVLKGDMSMVGPRPQVPVEVATYTAEEREILSVRPGITDWSSLKFHNEGEILAGHADPNKAYNELIRPEKMRLGLEYARRATLRDDVSILVKTFLVPFRR